MASLQRPFIIRPIHQACYRALINGGTLSVTDVRHALPGPLAKLDYGTVQSALNTLERRGYCRRERKPGPRSATGERLVYAARTDRMADILNTAAAEPRAGGAEARARMLDVHALAFDPKRAAAFQRARQRAQAARRPGSMAFTQWPSRAGNERRWPDGQGGWTTTPPVSRGDA